MLPGESVVVGQVSSLQFLFSSSIDTPSSLVVVAIISLLVVQSDPPFFGKGLLHRRVLDLMPPPQV